MCQVQHFTRCFVYPPFSCPRLGAAVSDVLISQSPCYPHSYKTLCPTCCFQNCVHSDSKLWLIFEWVDQDLKRYMNSCKSNLEPMLIKVGPEQREGAIGGGAGEPGEGD